MIQTTERAMLFILKEGKMLRCKELLEVQEVKSMILLKHEVDLNEVNPSNFSE